MGNANHEDVMAILESVPEVREENNSLRVQLAIAILKQRLSLNLTQEAVVRLVLDNGEAITQATISKIEGAESDVKISSYEKVFKVLDLHADVLSMRERQEASRRTSRHAVINAAIRAQQGLGKTYSAPHTFEPDQVKVGVFSDLNRHSNLGRINRVAAKLAKSGKLKGARVRVEPTLEPKNFKTKNHSK